VAPLQKRAVERSTEDVVQAFLEDEMEVDVACGSEYEPMRVRVSEFVPVNDKVSSLPAITTEGQSKIPVFTRRYPAPVALKALDMQSLEASCRRHANSVATIQLDGLSNRQMNPISERLLGVIRKYRTSNSRYLNVCPLFWRIAGAKYGLIFFLRQFFLTTL
jgi:hypothetical protein